MATDMKTNWIQSPRRRTPKALGLIALVACFIGADGAQGDGGTVESQTKVRPNIVYILADDLGWGDVGWNGSDIPTPNLDALARSGTRLEAYYVQPVCSPTRAAFLTGRYPIRHGLQVGVVRPWATYGLPLAEQTLPEGLKTAGYKTAIVGKWHLGHNDRAYLPTRRGFDHQYGHYNGAIDYFTHFRDEGFDWHRDDQVNRDEGYATELLGREAVRIVDTYAGKEPYFLYVPFNAVHSPLQVPDKYLEGLDHLKGQRRLYAGLLRGMDEAIGSIVEAVDKSGTRDNTLFIFSSDNGGPQPGRVSSNGPLRAGKGTVYEGGVRVAAFASWTGKIPAGTHVDEPLHIVDWYPTLLGLTGASVDQKRPLDGKDVWETIANRQASPHEDILINATPRAGALRKGDWKIVVNGGQANDGFDGEKANAPPTDKIELFHLATDLSEKNNVAEANPEVVADLLARFKRYQSEAASPLTSPKPKGFRSPAIWGE